MTAPEDDNDNLSVGITLYPTDGEEAALRQIGLGLKPLVLIEGSETEDGILLEFTGSLVDSQEELVDMLENALEGLKLAVAQAAEEDE